MRLFIALDIDEAIRTRINRFVEGVNGFATDARWVRPESLHVTLKFIGEQPESAVDLIKHALSDIHGSAPEIGARLLDRFGSRSSTRGIGLVDRRQDGDAGNSKRRPCLQSAPHSSPGRRRFRLSTPEEGRRAQSDLSAPAGQIDRAAHSGVWYDDGPRVLLVSKPAFAQRIEVHKAGAI
jgi:hypothetical protein